MKKTVLDIGNCGPDHSAIGRMLTSHFDVCVLQGHEFRDALQILETQQVDLVLINRKLDKDYSDGMDVLKRLKADSRFAKIPVMIVSNYGEVQDEAVQLGALRGFGKLSLASEDTLGRLASVFGESSNEH